MVFSANGDEETQMINGFKSVMVVAGNEKQPCGVRDYARLMKVALADESSREVDVLQSCYGVHRINLGKLRAIRKRVIQKTCDIQSVSLVHVQYSDYSWNGVRVYEDLYEVFTRRCRFPLVVTIHEHPWFRNEHYLDRPKTLADFVFLGMAGYRVVPKSLPLELMDRHRGIHVHHEWQKTELSRYGVPASKIRVIPIYIPECHAGADQVVGFKKRYGLEEKRIITLVGFVLERKRYDRVLELLPDLPPDVVVCVLGGINGPASEKYLATLQDRACQLGVSSRFVVTGYLPDLEMNAGLLSADVFVAPYEEVTSSASVARCIGAGAPIVAGKCPTFVELEVDGAGVLVVNPEDKVEMRGVLLGLLREDANCQILRQKNIEYATKWSLANVAKAIQDWYRECLA